MEGGPGRGDRRARALRLPAAVGAAAAAALLAASCGGGTPQNANEKEATYDVRILHASFPARQAVSRPTALTLAVTNAGSTAIPIVAVTIDSFTYRSKYPELASRSRPVWVVEKGPGPAAHPPVETQEVSIPGGAVTAYVNTWALGPLAPHATHVFRWDVVPVRRGIYPVHFSVAAGLSGKAKAQRPNGSPARGAFLVRVAPAPPRSHVDPNTGKVVEGPPPATETE